MVNYEKLDTAIDHAVAYPEEFDMGTWGRSGSCGTVACLAGTTALLDGWQFLYASESGRIRKNGVERYVQSVAMDVLGLDTSEIRIFYRISLESVIERRNEWARRDGVPERAWDLPERLTTVYALSTDD